MKKIANRVLALIVALTVLLMPAAMAAEQNMAVLSIGNFEFAMGEESISLPVTLQLGGGADLEGGRGMALLQLLVGEQVGGTVYGALENEEIKLYIDGMDYGLYIPLADVIAMVESEMGSAMTEMEEVFTPELQTAMNDLMTAAAALETAEVDPDAMLSALGVTVTGEGVAETEIFGETVSANKSSITVAPQTMQGMLDAMSSVNPAFADYWTSYSAFLTQVMAETGEEVDLAEVLSMVTLGANGVIYANETDVSVELALALTAEGETVELPISVAVREAETGSAVEVILDADIEGETLLVTFTVEENTTEAGSTFGMVMGMGIYDTESGEAEGEFTFTLSGSDTADGVSFGFSMDVDDGYDPVSFNLDYSGTHAQTSGDATSWDGAFILYAVAEGEEIYAAMDTNLTLSAMPEGELLTLGEGSLNALEMGDAEMEQFMVDAQVPLMQLIGTLMQDQTIAALLSDAMGLLQ